MDKRDKTTEILFQEYLRFQSNPQEWFGRMTNTALNIIVDEFDKLDTEKVLRQLDFFHVFVENLESLSEKSITKLYKYANRYSDTLVLQWLYSRMAIITDLIKAGIITGKSLNADTQTIQTILYGVIKHVNIVYWFVKGFVERYKPNQTHTQYESMMNLVGINTLNNNPDEYSNESKALIRREFNSNDSNLYS